MREVLISKKVFQFDELEPEVQAEVLEKYRLAEVSHHGWWDPIYEGIRENLREFGIDNIEMQFSGFGSQGDGASFTSKDVDLAKFIEKLGLKDKFSIILDAVKIGDVTAAIVRNTHHYVHERSVDFAIESDMPSQFGDVFEEFEQYVSQWLIRYCREIYHKLEKYYDELTSDKNVKLFITENLGEFEENGELYLDIDSEVSEEGENDGNNNKSETTS